MEFHSVILISDWLFYLLLLATVEFILIARQKRHWQIPFATILSSKIGMVTLCVLLCYVLLAFLDSIHFYYGHAFRVDSLLEWLLQPLGTQDEKTYSAPFAFTLYHQSDHLVHAAHGIQNTAQNWQHILWLSIKALIMGLMSFAIALSVMMYWLAKRQQTAFKKFVQRIYQGQTQYAWREAVLTLALIWLLSVWCYELSRVYHILGTDKVGHDVFLDAIKSIRTGLLIGTLTTLFMLPFALALGITAGYFGGWVDDVIQYIYITLSSIPGVLLITAAILVLQVYIYNHPELFPTLIARADARLIALCLILGITSWTNLCRLLRGETFKLRQLEFIQAARALGLPRYKILMKHILPNVMHIVLITVVLDFSMLVLAEAVLSYVGVGVDPTTMSWGNMINSSRLELAREPMVWWPLLAALIFMFGLVLSANLFADKVRDAFDPRLG